MARESQADHDRRRAALDLRLAGRSYADIGSAIGVTRQRAQQILSPSREVVDTVIAREGGRCEGCAVPAGRSGHIHHRRADGMTPETYNAEPNLTLLCIPCHQHAHKGYAEPRQLLTPEQRAAVNKTQGPRIAAGRLKISPEEYRAHREAGEKWCSVHKSWEPIERFGKHKSAADGLANRCREANRALVRVYQTKEYQRDYYRRNARRLNAYRSEWARRKRQAEKAVAS
jgi:hypothetical protein